MKVLVTGSNGQLGFEVITELKKLGIEHKSTDRTDLDITDEYCVKKIIGDYLPDVIIHCAAYTSVDKAEDQKEECYRVNVLGTRYIAEACKQINAKLIYISTDYVFDGKGDSPFEVSDQPDPVNFYGLTKLRR